MYFMYERERNKSSWAWGHNTFLFPLNPLVFIFCARWLTSTSDIPLIFLLPHRLSSTIQAKGYVSNHYLLFRFHLDDVYNFWNFMFLSFVHKWRR